MASTWHKREPSLAPTYRLGLPWRPAGPELRCLAVPPGRPHRWMRPGNGTGRTGRRQCLQRGRRTASARHGRCGGQGGTVRGNRSTSRRSGSGWTIRGNGTAPNGARLTRCRGPPHGIRQGWPPWDRKSCCLAAGGLPGWKGSASMTRGCGTGLTGGVRRTWSPPSRRSPVGLRHVGERVVALRDGHIRGPGINYTWEFDGTAWTRQGAAASPPVSAMPELATLGAKVVLFGRLLRQARHTDESIRRGNGTAPDGSSALPTTHPSARRASHALSCRRRPRGPLWRRLTAPAPLGDTWEWDGTEWELKTPAVSPAAQDERRGCTRGREEAACIYGGNPVWATPGSGTERTGSRRPGTQPVCSVSGGDGEPRRPDGPLRRSGRVTTLDRGHVGVGWHGLGV